MSVQRSWARWTSPIVILIASFLFLGVTELHGQEKVKADCTPSFPFKQSWWGADAAYSIPLPDRAFCVDFRGHPVWRPEGSRWQRPTDGAQ
jgi:hypothetical protein